MKKSTRNLKIVKDLQEENKEIIKDPVKKKATKSQPKSNKKSFKSQKTRKSHTKSDLNDKKANLKIKKNQYIAHAVILYNKDETSDIVKCADEKEARDFLKEALKQKKVLFGAYVEHHRTK